MSDTAAKYLSIAAVVVAVIAAAAYADILGAVLLVATMFAIGLFL